LMGRTEIKKPWVGGDVEWHLPKPVKALIHAKRDAGAPDGKRTSI
jgi:hypothetical protein